MTCDLLPLNTSLRLKLRIKFTADVIMTNQNQTGLTETVAYVCEALSFQTFSTVNRNMIVTKLPFLPISLEYQEK